MLFGWASLAGIASMVGWSSLGAYNQSLPVFAANASVETFNGNTSHFEALYSFFSRIPDHQATATEIPEALVFGDTKKAGGSSLHKFPLWPTGTSTGATEHKAERTINVVWFLFLAGLAIFYFFVKHEININSHIKELRAELESIAARQQMILDETQEAVLELKKFQKQSPPDLSLGPQIGFPVLDTQQHHDLQAAISTFKAISAQTQSSSVSRRGKRKFPTAIVPPHLLVSSGSSSQSPAKSSSPESLAPPNTWLKALETKAKEEVKTCTKSPGVKATKTGPQDTSATSLPEWSQKATACEQHSSFTGVKPSFDISTANGRKALRTYIEDKKNCQPVSEKSQTLCDVNEIARPTYAEVCKHDPVTKKKYRRVFVASRGWISMHKFEEEEKKFGSNTVVMGRPEESKTEAKSL